MGYTRCGLSYGDKLIVEQQQGAEYRRAGFTRTGRRFKPTKFLESPDNNDNLPFNDDDVIVQAKIHECSSKDVPIIKCPECPAKDVPQKSSTSMSRRRIVFTLLLVVCIVFITVVAIIFLMELFAYFTWNLSYPYRPILCVNDCSDRYVTYRKYLQKDASLFSDVVGVIPRVGPSLKKMVSFKPAPDVPCRSRYMGLFETWFCNPSDSYDKHIMSYHKE